MLTRDKCCGFDRFGFGDGFLKCRGILEFCSRSSWMIRCVSESAGSMGMVSTVGSALWARRFASATRKERTVAAMTTAPSINESDVAAGFFMGIGRSAYG